jgi:hypothetical protein
MWPRFGLAIAPLATMLALCEARLSVTRSRIPIQISNYWLPSLAVAGPADDPWPCPVKLSQGEGRPIKLAGKMLAQGPGLKLQIAMNEIRKQNYLTKS